MLGVRPVSCVVFLNVGGKTSFVCCGVECWGSDHFHPDSVTSLLCWDSTGLTSWFYPIAQLCRHSWVGVINCSMLQTHSFVGANHSVLEVSDKSYVTSLLLYSPINVHSSFYLKPPCHALV